MSSPTARTLDYERTQGHTVQVVEHWNPFARCRVDLFKCIDIVSLSDSRIKGIQCTSGSNHAARETKAKDTPAIKEWLVCGGLFEVQSWRKNSKGKWAQRITRACLNDNKELNFREL